MMQYDTMWHDTTWLHVYGMLYAPLSYSQSKRQRVCTPRPPPGRAQKALMFDVADGTKNSPVLGPCTIVGISDAT